ncbi:hypothetical protein QTN47_21195 [Danxiaibacter flavus]|uniref:Uncharacterized protein n=1 Tax=Danxiaibacter flavus TaxID=3049108 RepID=A0ABV3ZJH8_9BACT|nr:hypothetical protein QNM32_21200 [Chitinophagaceae bacterium DXS]
MPVDVTKSIFFAGGRVVHPENVDDSVTQGIKLTKIDGENGGWVIDIQVFIPDVEAKGIINKYDDFILDAGDDFEKKIQNQVYFEAFDADKKSIVVKLDAIELTVLKGFKQEDGQIMLRMSPSGGVGKTQNSNIKTQNADTTLAAAMQEPVHSSN